MPGLKKLLLSLPFLFLSAHAAAGPAVPAPAPKPLVAPVLEDLRYHHETSAMMPYYRIVRDGNGYICRISPSRQERTGRYSEARASSGEVARLLDALMAAGALAWDGFSKRNPAPSGVLDGDDRFSFSMTLGNGRTVKAEGSRARPAGFSQAEEALLEFFRTHEDYSRYYPKAFPAEEPFRMEIAIGPEFGSKYSQSFRITLSRPHGQWSLALRDPDGEYLAKGFSISGHQNGVADLPMRDLLALLRKYGFEQRNGTEEKSGRLHSPVAISIYWAGDLEYSFRSNAEFEGRAAFIRELIAFIRSFHAKHAGAA